MNSQKTREATVLEEGAGPEPLRDAVLARLWSSGYGALRRVTVEVSEGAIVLRGGVPTFHHKQVAQVIVLGMGGWRRVRNLIEVHARADEAPVSGRR